MGLFKRIYKGWKTAGYWTEALDFYTKDKPIKSLVYLKKYNLIRPFKSKEKTLQGLVYYELKKVDQAVECFRWAFDNIGQDKRQNIDEDKYLATYIISTLGKICNEHNIEIDILDEKLKDYNFDKSKVRKAFIWAFPL